MRLPRPLLWALLAVAVLVLLLVPLLRASGPPPALLVSTTTSLDNSGLLAALASNFTRETGVRMYFIPVGSGHAIELARRGDVDLALTHAPSLEEPLVAQGYFSRTTFATNRFQIVGPPGDPAGVKGLNASEAFRRFYEKNATFASRGDNSGTHVRERLLWAAAGYNYSTQVDVPTNAWYLSTGSGMGATLQKASELGAYTLTDEGTFRTYQSKLNLEVLNLGDEPAMKNIYSLLLLNETRFPGRNYTQVHLFAWWLLSPEGLGDVGAYDGGLFHPLQPGTLNPWTTSSPSPS